MFLSLVKPCNVFVILPALFSHNYVTYCLCFTGESSFEVQTKADSNDITEHPHDDKPRLYVCEVCDKWFTSKLHLNYHKMTHTGEKLYSCTQCGQRITTQSLMTAHMNVHSSKYKCTECEKSFRQNKKLSKHRRVQTGVKAVSYTHLTLPTNREV